jgi:LmbE family N-acetylglucosaminyl deacetylase
MFIFRIHSENTNRSSIRLPELQPPDEGKRILVFAPHCDDEVLGCSGLLQQAVKSGAEARVVVITNGDGFRVAVEREFRTLNVEPKDYIQFAGIRQQETYRALKILGVSRDDVTFLGYPDRGLMPLWTDFWSPDRHFRSLYTGLDNAAYDLAFNKGAPYCGSSLLNDIKSVMRDARPTDIYVTHPSDDHPDHCAAAAFVTLAFRQLKEEDDSWTDKAKLHYYLIHRGDWPAPQGLQKHDAMVPPGDMANLDTDWASLPLSEKEVNRKVKSIFAYPSQTAIMKRFLVSFARRNELFGDLNGATATKVADNSIHIDGDTSEWTNIRPMALDPVNDNLIRDFQAGGDVKAVYACRDSKNLYFRVDTYQNASKQVEFKIRLRYFGESARGETGGTFTATIHPGSSVLPAHIEAKAIENRLELAVPLRDIGYAHHLAVNVETNLAGLQIDRTGYRFLDL